MPSGCPQRWQPLGIPSPSRAASPSWHHPSTTPAKQCRCHRASCLASGSDVLSASCAYVKAERAEIIQAIGELTLLSWETQNVSPLSLARGSGLWWHSTGASLQERGQQLEQLQKSPMLPSTCFPLHTQPQHNSLVRTLLGMETHDFPEAKNSLWSKRDGPLSLSPTKKLGLR